MAEYTNIKDKAGENIEPSRKCAADKPKQLVDKTHRIFHHLTSYIQPGSSNPGRERLKKNENHTNEDSLKSSLNKVDKKPIATDVNESHVKSSASKTNNVQNDRTPAKHGTTGDSLKKNFTNRSEENHYKKSRINSLEETKRNFKFSNNNKNESYDNKYKKPHLSKSLSYDEYESKNSNRMTNKSRTFDHSRKTNSHKDNKQQQYEHSPKKNGTSPTCKLDNLNSKFVDNNACQSESNDFCNYIYKNKKSDLDDDYMSSEYCLSSSESRIAVSSCNLDNSSIDQLIDEDINDSGNIAELPDNFSEKEKHIEEKGDKIFITFKCDIEKPKVADKKDEDFSNSLSTVPFPLFPVDDLSIQLPFQCDNFIPPPHPVDCNSIHANGYNSINDVDNSDFEKQNDETLNYVNGTSLYDEISSFLKETEIESTKITKTALRVITEVNNVVKYYFHGSSIILYGSYLSELAVNSSNINLALKSNQSPNNSLFLQIRNKLYDKLNDKGYHIESYENATNDRKVKISFSEGNLGRSCELVYAGKTVELAIKMNNLLKTIFQYDTRIKTLIVATRIWAEACLILDAENGKLHAIGYTLMVIYFLQQIECPVLPIVDLSSENEPLPKLKQKNQASVGELWLEFLKFYNEEFDWRNYVVCITEKNKVTKKSKSWENWIAIEDPYSKKNIAASVVKSDVSSYIHACFSASYDYFMSPTSNSNSDNDTDYSDSQTKDDDKEVHQKYSFTHCSAMQESLPVCEECEEYGGVCGNCLGLTQVPEDIPEVCQDSLKYVDSAIEDIYTKNILSDDNIKGRIAFVKDLELYVKKKFPGARLSLFGSSVNGFGFESSDLDICLTMRTKFDNTKNIQGILRGLTSHLRYDEKKRYENVFCLYRAAIPLIKFSSALMGWKCDISLCNVLAVHNSKLLNTYALFDERCRKLGCALKLLTKKANIAECVDKSLSSYSYILMTIHYLQQVEPPVLPVFPVLHKKEFEKSRKVPDEIFRQNEWYSYKDIDVLRKKYPATRENKSTVAELWIGLLEFYLKYDHEYAITITQKEPLLTSELQRSARLFNIEDPFLEKRNLGCIVSEPKAYEIQKIFRNARILFGREKPKDVKNLKDHYFSSMNITGRFIKDTDCSFCGAYGHDKDTCKKFKPYRSSKHPSSYSQWH